MAYQPEQRRVPILMYHSLSDQAQPRFRKFALSPALFAAQMAYLKQRHYTTLTVSQYVSAIGAGVALPESVVVLTFDDGFADFYTEALPILQQHDFTATLYISTAFVDGMSRFLQREGEADRPMLTWGQLIDIDRSGIECGAHSHRHVQLDVLPLAVVRDELTRCKQVLEGKLSKGIDSFAYPYGYYRPAVRRLVQAAGYSSACAVKYRLSLAADDVFALPRLIVPANTRVEQFDQLLSGRGPQLEPAYERARALAWRWARYGKRLVERNVEGKESYETSLT